MAKGKIYKESKTAMQSGRAKTHQWTLDFQPIHPPHRDPLMGWVSAQDTNHEVKLHFENLEAAKLYCDHKGIEYTVLPDKTSSPLTPKTYSDNFCHTKRR
jgi:NADH dehydrogenase